MEKRRKLLLHSYSIERSTFELDKIIDNGNTIESTLKLLGQDRCSDDSSVYLRQMTKKEQE